MTQTAPYKLVVIILFLANCSLALAQEKEVPSSTPNYFEFQTKRNHIYVGTDFGVGLGFKSESLTITEATTLVDASFSPKIGFFPVRQLLIGGIYDLSSSLTVLEGQDQYYLTNSAYGIFGRYYLKNGLFAEASYGWGNGYELARIAGSDFSEKNNFDSRRKSLSIGISNYWLKRFNFEVLLRYSQINGNYSSSDTRKLEISGLAVKAGVGFSIGK